MNQTSDAIYHILEWITRFAYMNLLWILFTFLGGIVFGFFPSTIAMFALMRDWMRGNTNAAIFTSFWSYYKKDFFKSNRLGILIVAITLLVSINMYYIQLNTTAALSWTYIPLFAFIFLFIMFLFYIFPVFVHFDLNVGQLIKNAFLIMLIHPLHSFFIILCLGSLYFVMNALPALAFIFGGSAYAFVTTWLGLHAIQKVHKQGKQQL